MDDLIQNSEKDPGTPTGALPTTAGERFRAWMRVALFVLVVVLLVGFVFLFSLHQALQARVENQERRIERINAMVDDLLMAQENAQKIEHIEQQVNLIDGHMKELTDTIKAQGEEPEDTKRKKRKR